MTGEAPEQLAVQHRVGGYTGALLLLLPLLEDLTFNLSTTIYDSNETQNVQTDCFPSSLTPVTLHPGYDFDDIWSPSTVSQNLTYLFFPSLDGVLPQEWASQSGGMVKRNMVVADDAAFREKSKMLTSMERQKWLNSYMQKLLVVNSA
ncbi:Tuberoinfundibular peptide [Takifugu flavidus]|uniref:Tuberoinfundibular peptide of 39 residues n=1 Tax=Takifugu flavidus TaxID=433684 RepID=A0A5C6NVZ5_9TELE|nr:Tuberoinfundibular peptide [Takifugu flavidus]